MRITCDVEVCNRLLPAFNMKGGGKSVRAQLSVGRKPGAVVGADVWLMICTKQDRNGAKYRLKGNIQQCFTKFAHEGKATIRFVEPPHDICLNKADPVQLKGFLSVLRLGYQGKGLEKVMLSSLAPASAKQVEKLKTKMAVTSRKDYPLTTGFPNSLEMLQVCQCKLKRIDSRMLDLRSLRVLNLGHNHIQTLPEDFKKCDMLAELHLMDNQICDIPRGFCTGVLSKTLTLLDLTKNKIKILRPFFCNLSALVTLKLDQNELVCLPPMLGQMARLRFLSASKNQLKTLPASFTGLRLDSLDMFDNPFLQDGPSTAINRLESSSLLECAARAIRKNKVEYTLEDVPGPLFDLLNSGRLCLCGSYCFRSHVHYLARLDLHRVADSITGIDQSGRTNAPAEAFLCSEKCFARYQNNPYKTFW